MRRGMDALRAQLADAVKEKDALGRGVYMCLEARFGSVFFLLDGLSVVKTASVSRRFASSLLAMQRWLG